ncbi:probable serine/threonine-protein kinase nek3 [Rhagoletis pomonella]|uniref:probable serine/threonine-protein kinase nek3 n=1 Tax=Rhagoletis pomonella TaxID=28610 RepID=UPI0017870D34|nr:probable serine/threonine-protein kinase nek3 [Rhagoletis pomonella]
MPSKKKKYNARFPAGRIKKIMQSDEEIGKVAQAVPVIISRTLELFVESLLTKTLRITNSRNAKTLSTSHMKQCIMSEQRFDFLRELVKNVPDISVAEEAANYNEEDGQSSPEDVYPDSDTPYDLSMPSTSGGRNNNRGVAATKANGGQTNYQYKQQYQQPPQNGSGNDSGMTETDLRQRMRQRISGTQSVIMHTASVVQSQSAAATPLPATASHTTLPSAQRGVHGNYVQPLKLMRSESSPANAAQHMWHIAPNAATPQQQGQGQQKRLRHQAQSVACSNNNDNCFDSSPPKRQKCEPTTQQTHSQTAIPAPVFSYDLCNKPIVKIDYSNLPLTPAIRGTSEQLNTTAAIGNLSLSAPVRNASFNFSVDAPIINIDLSNIVTTCVESKKTKGNNVPAPAVATISIGALPVELANAGATQPTSTGNIYGKIGADKASSTSTTPPSIQSTDSKTDSNTTTVDSTSSSASSSSCSPSSSFASTSANSQQGGNKAMLKASTDIMAKMTAPRKNALSATCKNSNSCFELDEDYDNI